MGKTLDSTAKRKPVLSLSGIIGMNFPGIEEVHGQVDFYRADEPAENALMVQVSTSR